MTINQPILELKSIHSILGEKFLIPSYQRGYRWKPVQVEALLRDLWEFSKKKKNDNEFYCLQPVVVKRDSTSNEYEVLDGQQRLTTIRIILSYLAINHLKIPIAEAFHKGEFQINYETKPESAEFLKEISFNDENVDFYSIWKAHEAVKNWFADKDYNQRNIFLRHLLANEDSENPVKIIWYDVGNVDVDPIDIFTRLNIGKIALTNAELIKALFLSKSTKLDDENRALKQISIAKEWDVIEQTLQQKDFWYFICNTPDKYDTRIEFIFDLMKTKPQDEENYFTFYQFEKDFTDDKDNPHIIDEIWLRIKEYFLTLEEWYQDRELYHLVGYLVAIGKDVNNLKHESFGKSKTAFKVFLMKEARKTVPENIEELNYQNGQDVRKTLLLFNILSILKNPKSNLRFPFHYYHNQKRDIEHIKSQTDKNSIGKDKEEWAITLLEYFTGEKWENQKQEVLLSKIKHLKKEEIVFCSKLLIIIGKKDEGEIIFNELLKEMKIYFREEDSFEDEDNIWNLTLLDETTNRMYKNAFFPVKRRHIINKEKEGVFIPLCTKNVFLKAYSQRLGEVMYWNQNDAQDYLNEIKTILN